MNFSTTTNHKKTKENPFSQVFKKTKGFLKLKVKNKEKYIAEKINKKYNRVTLPPIWPERIALAEKFSIHLKNMKGDCVSFLDKKNKIIFLTGNTKLLEKWENFALAHILGKWFLGHDTCSFYPSFIEKPRNSEDRQSNHFASYLLMPEKFIREYSWLKEDFAKVFRVPQQVADLRLSLK